MIIDPKKSVKVQNVVILKKLYLTEDLEFLTVNSSICVTFDISLYF